MKRLISAVIAIIMLISASSAFAGVIEDLNAIGILPQGLSFDMESEELITRAEFAYMTANLLAEGEKAAKDTQFADVNSSNPYSGYIDLLVNYGIVNGSGGKEFNPDDNITVDAASKMLVVLLGYGSIAEKKGGFPDGYVQVAYEISLYKDVETNGNFLTRYNAAQLIHNALLADVDSNYSYGITSVRPLCDFLDISAYKGIMIDTDASTNSATFKVEKNLYDENVNYLTEGTEYKFDSSKYINVTDYERVPATVWVNKNDEIVNVIPIKNSKVLYGYVSHINGNTSQIGAFPISAIKELMFINDEEEYDVQDGLLVKYNNEYSKSALNLCGKFVKAVIVNGYITFIESFDIKEGGIITEITARKLVYTRGESIGLTIQDIDLKKNVRVFVNNKSADIKDVRVGTIFDFYETDSDLVIVSSERCLYDTFNLYQSGKVITLGTTDCSIEGDIYSSTDGINFTKNSKVMELIGQNVKLYIAPNGYAKYIVADNANETANEFYGIVGGVQYKASSIDTDVLIKLFKLSEKTAEEGIYTITEKTKISGFAGITDITDFINNNLIVNQRDTSNGKNVYKFKVNNEKKITQISAPTYFYGTTELGSGLLSGTGDADRLSVANSGGLINFSNSRVIFYPTLEEGEFVVKEIPWTTIKSKTFEEKFTVRYYGEGKIAEPEHIIAYGGLDTVFPSSTGLMRGIYTGQNTLCVDEKGETYREITIITPKEEKVYAVSEEFFANLNNKTGGAGLITYTELSIDKDESIRLYDLNDAKSVFLNFSSQEDEWLDDNSLLPSTKGTMGQGCVEKIAGNRIYFDDGKAYYIDYYWYLNAFAKVYENGNGKKFKLVTLNELEPGDMLYYYLDTNKILQTFIKIGE